MDTRFYSLVFSEHYHFPQGFWFCHLGKGWMLSIPGISTSKMHTSNSFPRTAGPESPSRRSLHPRQCPYLSVT